MNECTGAAGQKLTRPRGRPLSGSRCSTVNAFAQSLLNQSGSSLRLHRRRLVPLAGDGNRQVGASLHVNP